ncbi:MAG: DMT family transporter, partial [Gammaproteobacteria bacterium]|nr:DMT family transporter [Gammaproteobacteria bacterium]
LARQSLRLPRNLLVPSLVVGIAAAAFVYGIFGAIVSINISLAILILYLYPMALATWEHFSGSSRLQPAQWAWGLVAGVGLAFILGVNVDQVSYTGVALALLAMLASVVITLVNIRVVAVAGSLVSNLYMSLWTLLIFGAALALFGEFHEPQTTAGWIGLAGNGVAYCVSWVAFFAGARILGTTRASMITLIEPPLAALFAWIIFGESFSLPQWFGFAIVLAALFMFEKLARAGR